MRRHSADPVRNNVVLVKVSATHKRVVCDSNISFGAIQGILPLLAQFCIFRRREEAKFVLVIGVLTQSALASHDGAENSVIHLK